MYYFRWVQNLCSVWHAGDYSRYQPCLLTLHLCSACTSWDGSILAPGGASEVATQLLLSGSWTRLVNRVVLLLMQHKQVLDMVGPVAIQQHWLQKRRWVCLWGSQVCRTLVCEITVQHLLTISCPLSEHKAGEQLCYSKTPHFCILEADHAFMLSPSDLRGKKTWSLAGTQSCSYLPDYWHTTWPVEKAFICQNH